MSHGHRTLSRGFVSTAVIAAGALASSLFITASPGAALDPGNPQARPAAAKPLTVAAAEHRLQVLDRQAEVASEAYNTVRVHVQQARAKLTVLQADVTRQQTRVAALRRDLVGAVLDRFNSGGGLSTATAMFVSRSPGQFLNSLATNAIVQRQQAELLAQLGRERDVLAGRQADAQRELASIVADQRQLAAHKATLDAHVKAARQLVGRLKERQRQRLLALQRHQTSNPNNYQATSRAGERPPGHSAPVSGRAAVAVATALAQIGKPYVYGAAGPYSFDCSGLTMYSWRAAGVSLSHSSSIQSGQGVPVSISDLQPGDLVFYYSPVSHVAMYIGHGMVVHAPHPGSVVQVVPLYSMPISWARRVG